MHEKFAIPSVCYITQCHYTRNKGIRHNFQLYPLPFWGGTTERPKFASLCCYGVGLTNFSYDSCLHSLTAPLLKYGHPKRPLFPPPCAPPIRTKASPFSLQYTHTTLLTTLPPAKKVMLLKKPPLKGFRYSTLCVCVPPRRKDEIIGKKVIF